MKKYIGVCRDSPRHANYGQIWSQDGDGFYKSFENWYENFPNSSFKLSETQVLSEVENGYLVELTDETITKLKELGRNPTTIELADYLSGRLFLRKADEELNITNAIEEKCPPRKIGEGAFTFPSEEYSFPTDGD